MDGTRSMQQQERAKVERSVDRSIIAVIMVYSISLFPIIILLVTVTIHELYERDIAPELRTTFVWKGTISYVNGALTPSYMHIIAIILDVTIVLLF